MILYYRIILSLYNSTESWYVSNDDIIDNNFEPYLLECFVRMKAFQIVFPHTFIFTKAWQFDKSAWGTDC